MPLCKIGVIVFAAGRETPALQILQQPFPFGWSIRRLSDPRPWLAFGLVVGALFALDLIADPQISVIAIYVALIVAALRNIGRRAVTALGILCGVLTVASHVFLPDPSAKANLVDAVFGLVAIGATTLFTLRIDRSDRRARAAQADLAHVSRLLLVDTLNTAMAHELNQPLGAAAANAHAALRWLAASPPNRGEADRALRRTVEAIDYAGALVHQRRDLARRSAPSQAVINFRALLAEACGLVEERIRRHEVDLRVRIAEDLTVSGDRVRLQQVLINLMVNAIEAMSDVPHAPILTIKAMAEEGWVVVRVLDVGCGLDPALREHLFEPFRTSKPEGLGMGLAISRSIIEAHGGSIQAEAQMPHGSVFTIRLPRATSDA